MQVLGAVREINELDLVVSLPNGLAGYVSLAESALLIMPVSFLQSWISRHDFMSFLCFAHMYFCLHFSRLSTALLNAQSLT